MSITTGQNAASMGKLADTWISEKDLPLDTLTQGTRHLPIYKSLAFDRDLQVDGHPALAQATSCMGPHVKLVRSTSHAKPQNNNVFGDACRLTRACGGSADIFQLQ